MWADCMVNEVIMPADNIFFFKFQSTSHSGLYDLDFLSSFNS